MERKKITFDSFIRGSIGCVLVVGILMLVERLSGVLLPFFIAWLIAYMVYPLVKFFQYKLRLKSRIISIFCSLFLITVIGVTLFYLLVPPMISEIGRMNDLLVTYLTNGAGNNVPKNLSEFIHENIDLQALNRVLSEENILAAIKDTVPRVWTLLAESLNILFSILASFIILLYVIFILLDYEAIAEGWLHLLPNKYRTFASNLVHDVQDGMNRYFRGQALVAFCVGILFSIGFLIIDFPMAIALGLFIGALNMVPYLQIIGFLPTILLAILKAADTGQNFWIIIACALAVFAIVQIIQDTFLVPKIMGKITGLNPAIILLSLSIWGSLMGMLGMIIALPLTTLMLSYYQRFIINKEKIKYDEVCLANYLTITPKYEQLEEMIWMYTDDVLNFYRPCYRDEALQTVTLLLPDDMQLALFLDKLRSDRKDNNVRGTLEKIKQCLGVYPKLDRAITAYAKMLRDNIEKDMQERDQAIEQIWQDP